MNTTTKTLLALGLLSALPITLLADALANTSSQTLSPWQIRARMIDVAPTGSSSTITGLGGQVNDISSDTVPELDISYFFSDHVSAELILATSKHDVTATGTSAGNVDLGNVSVLPPTLTLQYHFSPDKVFNPYIGAGLSYVMFYNADSGAVADSVEYTNGFAPALQIGADFAINQHWMINIDAKYIAIQTEATANVGQNAYTTNVDINPFVYGVGIGYRF